jgi:hypothetical protein
MLWRERFGADWLRSPRLPKPLRALRQRRRSLSYRPGGFPAISPRRPALLTQANQWNQPCWPALRAKPALQAATAGGARRLQGRPGSGRKCCRRRSPRPHRREKRGAPEVGRMSKSVLWAPCLGSPPARPRTGVVLRAENPPSDHNPVEGRRYSPHRDRDRCCSELPRPWARPGRWDHQDTTREEPRWRRRVRPRLGRGSDRQFGSAFGTSGLFSGVSIVCLERPSATTKDADHRYAP